MIHHNLGHSIGYWLLDQTFYRLKCKWFREWTRIEGHDTTLYNTVICNYTFRAFSCEIASDLDLEHRCGFHTPFRCLLTTLPINIEDKNLWRHFSDCISELRWSWALDDVQRFFWTSWAWNHVPYSREHYHVLLIRKSENQIFRFLKSRIVTFLGKNLFCLQCEWL